MKNEFLHPKLDRLYVQAGGGMVLVVRGRAFSSEGGLKFTKKVGVNKTDPSPPISATEIL